MIGNPIFRREFITSCRTVRIKILTLIYLLSLAFVLLIMWPGGGVLSAVSESGRQIFQLFFTVNLTVLILLVPAFSATSVTSERENDTFAALYTTLLTPTEIMSGKLFSSILMLLILVSLSLPISALTALTGGITLIFLMKIFLILILSAVTYGLVGLACSCLCSKSTTSVMFNYVIILFLAGGTWLPGALLGNLLGYRAVWQALRSVSPFDALLYCRNPESYRLSMAVLPAGGFISPYMIFVIGSVAISVVAFNIFFRRILKPPAKFAKTQMKYTDMKTSFKRKLSWPFYLIDPLKRKKPIGRFANPVYVSELRSKLFTNPKFMIRAVSSILIVSLIILTLVSLQLGDKVNPETVWTVAILFQIGIVALVTPGISSGLITEEFANNTFISLRMTSITPGILIRGKLRATFFYAMIFLISSFFILFAMVYMEMQTVFPEGSILSGSWWSVLAEKAQTAEWWVEFWNTYRRIFTWLFILVLSTMTFLSAGLFCSAFSRNTPLATAFSYSISGIICVLSMAPLVLKERLSHSIAEMILSFNPIVGAMQASFGLMPQYLNLWKKNIIVLICLTVFFLVASTLRTWFLFTREER